MKLKLIAIAAVSVLSACTSMTYKPDMDKSAAEKTQQIQQKRDQFDASIKQYKARGIETAEVNRPYLVGRSTELSREVVLPAVLRANVPVETTFQAAGSVDLSQAATMISAATRLPVRVRPDALLPPSAFLPKIAGQAASSGTPGPVKFSMRVPEMPLASLLDYVAGQAGVYWRGDEKGVEFYRTDTRVFSIKTLSQKLSADASLGRSGSSGSLFDNTSRTSMSSKDVDPMDGVQKTIEAMLTRAGSVNLSRDTGTITVSDTKETLDRVADYVQRENKQLTRRVKLLFEAVDVQTKDQGQSGIDWNLVYSKINPATGHSTTYGTSSPLTTTDNQAGAFSIGLGGTGRMSGSSVLLHALSEVGTLVNHTKVPMMTINRRPISHAVRTTFNYVDQVQSTLVTSASGTVSQPTATQKEDTVGTVVTIVPDAQEDGQILMSIAFDETVLTSLKPFTVGSGSSAIQLQQKTIDGSGTVQQVMVRSGQTIVISGFERVTDQYDQRRLGQGVPLLLGGSDIANRSRTTKLLLVTAVVEEGL
jgi:type IVB pilus formation R64 PilN family outer membrane protein